MGELIEKLREPRRTVVVAKYPQPEYSKVSPVIFESMDEPINRFKWDRKDLTEYTQGPNNDDLLADALSILVFYADRCPEEHPNYPGKVDLMLLRRLSLPAQDVVRRIQAELKKRMEGE